MHAGPRWPWVRPTGCGSLPDCGPGHRCGVPRPSCSSESRKSSIARCSNMLSPPDPDSTDVTRAPSCSRGCELRRLNGYRRVLALCEQSQHISCCASTIIIIYEADTDRADMYNCVDLLGLHV